MALELLVRSCRQWCSGNAAAGGIGEAVEAANVRRASLALGSVETEVAAGSLVLMEGELAKVAGVAGNGIRAAGSRELGQSRQQRWGGPHWS